MVASAFALFRVPVYMRDALMTAYPVLYSNTMSFAKGTKGDVLPTRNNDDLSGELDANDNIFLHFHIILQMLCPSLTYSSRESHTLTH